MFPAFEWKLGCQTRNEAAENRDASSGVDLLHTMCKTS